MSQTSCVRHPAKAWFLKIYQWQLDFCDGNTCAAALMSYFEFCHNGKLQQLPQAKTLNDQLEKTPKGRTQVETLLQWHTATELEKGVLIYKRDKIAEAIKLLKEKGVIEVHRNPDPSRWFDRTQHFLFLPEVVNAWIDRICIVDKSEMPGETPYLPSINGNSEKQVRKIGNVPKNTEDKETKTTKNGPRSPAKRKSRRGPRESSSSFSLCVTEEDTETSTPRTGLDTPEGKGRPRVNGFHSIVTPADSNDLAAKLATKGNLSDAQKEKIATHIEHSDGGRAYVLQCEEAADSEPRENWGRAFMAAFRDGWKKPVSTVKPKPAKVSQQSSPLDLGEETSDENIAMRREGLAAVKAAVAGK